MQKGSKLGPVSFGFGPQVQHSGSFDIVSCKNVSNPNSFFDNAYVIIAFIVLYESIIVIILVFFITCGIGIKAFLYY